ncbi:MAG TPA: glycosyltransferase family 2 protein [Spirochaetota bacterium]|nr:glycosyltransferase family 2 protein [Spirochaetota bacterium]HOL56014.1 glycosyltransferase family 2 protein [Spirochaetota bacterium]HPP03456.1 glycosyltransferase family 2 protein [Spirochaetota bacterium]
MDNFLVSVIIPAYNEEGNIEILSEKLIEHLQKYSDYEIIFIDDGSKDGTLNVLKRLHSNNKKINYISFSRNFGHQNALRAGLNYAKGDCVISMDADLQHPPELIDLMIEKWKEGYEIVYTIRKDGKKVSFFKKNTAKLFYGLMNIISDVKIDPGAADFRLLDRKVVNVLKDINEPFLFMRGMIPWLGFRQYKIEYEVGERFWGKSKYSLKKMFMFALSGITSFSVKPLKISIFLGFLMAIVSFILGIQSIFIKLLTNQFVEGWATLLVSVFFIGSLQLLMLGIIGEYLGKLFIESKNRPNYIIREKSIDEDIK